MAVTLPIPADAPSSIAPIPQSERRLGGFENFVLWSDLGVSFLLMVTGMFLVPGLGLGEAFAAIIIGALIGNTLLGLAALIGHDVGVPTMVLLRASLGVRGSYLPTVVNVVQLLGWCTIEVIVMAQAADALLTRFFGFPSAYPLWIVVFTVLTVFFALLGPVIVVKRWLKSFVVWAVLISLVWLTIAVVQTVNIPALLAQPGTGTMSFWAGVDLVVALPISWFPLVADYSRFTRSRGIAFWGTAGGYFVPNVWFYALGAVLALSAQVVFDPNAPVTPFFAAIAGLTAGWLALIMIMVVEADESFANLYSTVVSVQNLVPNVSSRTLTLIGGAIVLVIGLTVPLFQYESFLLLIGAVFIPFLGILAADYFVVRGRYEVNDLYQTSGQYWYGIGVNVWAILTWAVGLAVYLTIAGLPAFGIRGLAPQIGASLPCFAVSFLLYAAIGRALVARR